MSESLTIPEPQPLENTEDANVFKFELHYDLYPRTVREILHEIFKDLASSTPVHNWDNKLTTNPLDSLAGVARSYMLANHDLNFHTLLGHSSVEEVFTARGVNHLSPAMEGPLDIRSHLFFNKVLVLNLNNYNI